MPNIFESFFEAALAIRELRGSEGYVAILQQELVREGVVARMAEERRVQLAKSQSAEPPTCEAEQLAIATKALEFYEDPGNYSAPRNGQPSAIARDKGRMARDALTAIAGGENEPEE